MSKAYKLLIILAFFMDHLHAQDSLWLVDLDSIIVKSTKLDAEIIGTQSYVIPSNALSLNAGDALSLYTPITFKQYGPGMLQSGSARGTGASHLGVNWNGINIQGMTHGQVDFGLLSVSEQITFITGGNSPMDGSGNLGGLVQLDTRFVQKSGLHGTFGGTIASFHNQQAHAQITYSKPRHFSSLSEIYYHQAKNDFPFVNTASVQRPLVKQTNNDLHTIQIRQSNQWVPNEKNILHFHYWLTNSHRQIPPTMTAVNDHSLQLDQAHRLVIDWKHILRAQSSILIKIANINEQLTFQNDGLYSFTATSKQVFDSRWEIEKKGHQFLLGAQSSLERAQSDGFGQLHQRITTAVFGASNFKFGQRFLLSAQARLEARDLVQWIPIFSIGSEYELLAQKNTHLILKGKAGRHYHVPTFNDLFWVGLGNADLLNETGYQGELSLSYKNKNLKTSVTVFRLNVDNWILWAPDLQGIWRPNNSKKVQSTGIESSFSYTYLRQQFQANIGLNYTYVRSINKEGKNIGKLLAYIPNHKGSGHINISYVHFGLLLRHIFVGSRSYNAANTNFLPAYSIQDIQLTYSIPWKQTKLKLHIGVSNLLDTAYQTVKFRPMPGRGFNAGIIVGF